MKFRKNICGNPLSEYAVDTRYPDIRYVPTNEEMEDAIKLMYDTIEEINKGEKKNEKRKKNG